MHPALRLLPLAAAAAALLHLHVATAASDNTTCAPATCGGLTIAWPFWLDGVQQMQCGYPAFQLVCDGGRGRSYLNRTFKEHILRVDEIFYDNASLVMAVEATFTGNASCPFPDFNVSSSLALLPVNISTTNKNLVFVYGYGDCKVQLPNDSTRIRSPSCGLRAMEAFITDERSYPTKVPENCSYVSVPVRLGHGAVEGKNLTELIGDGFLVEWEKLGDCPACKQSGGECRFDDGSFNCSCPQGSLCYKSNPTSRGTLGLGIKIGAGIAAAALCLTILSITCILVYYRRKRKRSASLDGLIRGEGTPLASLRKEQFTLTSSPRTHIFTYDELDEATNGFSEARELGVGGFGTVYKGTLRDGSVVAVKRLYKNSYKGKEQFQNEVEILSRLRHPNLVTLYGCTSPGSCYRDLLLVYEFVPNGTLADHLHGARAAVQPLAWGTRLGIAVETASALDYLHAVEPQVVHRDVKTNNILLDEGFHVKVADFGLSRLFPPDATHVSTAPQGTPGYVDPMYHQCYQLTDKSDVYSFGVVLAELISSKPAVDMNRTGADVNLANMAVHMIQSVEIDRLVDARLGYGRSDGETKRTVDLVAEVAFRCLQPEQDVRPPISEVLDVLREAQRMERAACRKDADVGLLKKSRDGSPDTVMYQWMSPSTTTTTASNSNHSS